MSTAHKKPAEAGAMAWLSDMSMNPRQKFGLRKHCAVMGDAARTVYNGFRNYACIMLTFFVTSKAMMTADQIVDGCGGTSALAAHLHVTPSTVSSWREVNFIPRWWHGQVAKAARKSGFAISPADFPTKADRRPRQVKAA